VKTPPSRYGTGDRRAATRDHIDAIAIDGLAYLANEPEHLARFFDSTGLAPHMLRTMAGTPGFNAALLDFLCANEALLRDFAARQNLDPAAIDAARGALADPPPEV
jgi:hypothetical protein